jgi:FkbM family methyltransferase
MNKILLYFRQFPFLIALKLSINAMFKRWLNPEAIVWYSQLGEDQYILSLLCDYDNFQTNESKGGFYVDVGSNHPIRFSNTFGLYCRGWRGICIEANSNLINKCKKIRKLDWAINAAVSDEEKDVDFYVSTLDLVSTIHPPFLEKEWAEGDFKLKEKVKMHTATLDTILDNFSKQTDSHALDHIDLLSIDVEGHDFNVLRSINLNKYRPAIIVIEMIGYDKAHPDQNEICQYLDRFKYDMEGYHMINGFFVARELKNKKNHTYS